MATYMKAGAILLLILCSVFATWKVQDWRYGNELSKQAAEASDQAKDRVDAVLVALTTEQDKRVALEDRLQANDRTHYKELSDAQKAQQRLSDRLATADVRLSVVLAPGPAGGGDGVSAPTSAGGVVHGATRAELDPAHAQRIVSITGEGDQGLIALKACQGYVRSVWGVSQRLAPP